MKIRSFILALMISIASLAFVKTSRQHSEKTYIFGQITDENTGQPVELVNVYLSNTTLGSMTDGNGNYSIKNTPMGSFELIISMLGYELQVHPLFLADPDSLNLNFKLKPKVLTAPEVITIEAPKPRAWRKFLKRFKREFLGRTSNASRCKIVNPEVLDFEMNEISKQLKATASQPLIIINKALGYQAEIILINFIYFKNGAFRCSIKPKFTELEPKHSKELKRWHKNRNRAYQGSLRHFLITLIHSKTREEGFLVYSSEYPRKTEPKFQNFMASDALDKCISAGISPFIKELRFKKFLVINFYERISSIEIMTPVVEISNTGIVYQRNSIVTYGWWAKQRFAEALPFDFVPGKDEMSF